MHKKDFAVKKRVKNNNVQTKNPIIDENQNQTHNINKESMGSNTKR